MTSRMKPLLTTATSAAKWIGVPTSNVSQVTADLVSRGTIVYGDKTSAVFYISDIEDGLKQKGFI